jgi:hypothetical protein
MIAFSTFLFLTSVVPVSAAPKEVCLYNQLKTKASFTYFVPGEPVPKGGYPVRRVKADDIQCIAVPGEPLTVLATTSKGETVACNWSLPNAKVQVNLSAEPSGLVCQQLVINEPAQ